MERVNSEKWSGVENFDKSYIYVHRQIGLNELTNMMYSIFISSHISRVIDENIRRMAKNGDLKTQIYGSKNISSCRA